ncbi:MAG: alanine racemase [Candidatus Aminicenantes bacterium]|nr:alanine racemase [Candidatus Aminicenantes bacterium]
MKLNRRDFMIFSGLSIASKNLYFKTNSKPERPVPESWIELNPTNIEWNLKKIKQKVKKPVMGVIKANAYGHGLVEFGKHLDRLGIDALMVCKLQEAVRLRESGINCPIYNFGPLVPENTPILLRHNISQFLHAGDFKAMSRKAEKRGAPINVHIHLDTGMHRMGLSHKEAISVLKQASLLKGLSISGLSTTLSEDKPFDKVQLKRLQSLYEESQNLGIPIKTRHAASSAGLFESKSYYLDMVRPGITLYGCYPNQETRKQDPLSLRPVLEFKSRVVDVKTINPGESVSYHRAYKAQKRETIAVIPVGYSDGYPPSVSQNSKVLIKGKKYPIINTVTANHMEALVSSDSPVSPGDEVTLIGSEGSRGSEKITADDVAQWAGISNYKVLIGLNPLVPRY